MNQYVHHVLSLVRPGPFLFRAWHQIHPWIPSQADLPDGPLQSLMFGRARFLHAELTGWWWLVVGASCPPMALWFLKGWGWNLQDCTQCWGGFSFPFYGVLGSGEVWDRPSCFGIWERRMITWHISSHSWLAKTILQETVPGYVAALSAVGDAPVSSLGTDKHRRHNSQQSGQTTDYVGWFLSPSGSLTWKSYSWTLHFFFDFSVLFLWRNILPFQLLARGLGFPVSSKIWSLPGFAMATWALLRCSS